MISDIKFDVGNYNGSICELNGKTLHPAAMAGMRIKFVDEDLGVIIKTEGHTMEQSHSEYEFWCSLTPEEQIFFAPCLGAGSTKNKDGSVWRWTAQEYIPPIPNSHMHWEDPRFKELNAELRRRRFQVWDWAPAQCGWTERGVIVYDYARWTK